MIYSEIGQIECDCKTEKIRAGEDRNLPTSSGFRHDCAASDSMLYFSNSK